MTEGKDYAPSEQRFKIANEKKDSIRGRRDDIAYERIDGLKELYWWLRSEIPEVRFAFSLFGSLSKRKQLTPKSAEETDVDVAIIFDEADLRKQHENLYAENEKYRQRYDAINTGRLLDRLPGSPEHKHGVVVSMAMNAYLSLWIRARAEEFLEGAIVHSVVQAIADDGPNSIYGRVSNFVVSEGKTVAIGERPPISRTNPFAQEIARFFHLDVGGGLREYRQHFLAKLSTMAPDVREHCWSVVDRCVRAVERDDVIPPAAEKQYPRTYDEAVKYYGLPSAGQGT